MVISFWVLFPPITLGTYSPEWVLLDVQLNSHAHSLENTLFSPMQFRRIIFFQTVIVIFFILEKKGKEMKTGKLHKGKKMFLRKFYRLLI